MQIVAVANQKGGVGKTTTVGNLAAALAEMSKRILVVDLDGQCNATTWLGAEPGQGILDVFEGRLNGLADVATIVGGISLMPASSGHSGVGRHEDVGSQDAERL